MRQSTATTIAQFDKRNGYNVSPKYTVINTPDLIKGFEANGYSVFSIAQARCNKAEKQGYQSHALRIRHNELSFSGGAAARGIVPEIVLTNSYDGQSCFRLMLGMFRLVCANGLIAGTRFEAIKVRHIGNVLDLVLDAAGRTAQDFPAMVDTVNHWSSVQLTANQQQSLALNAAELVLPVGAMLPNVDAILRVGRTGDIGNDLWTVFNRVQERVTTLGFGYTSVNALGTVQHRSTRAIKSISRNVGVNKQLWDLAQTYAK